MKKIPALLLAMASAAILLASSCTAQKDASVPPPVPKIADADPNRQKADVPGQSSMLTLRPDSQKVETKDQTCFFIYDRSHSCLYVTVHRELFEKIKGWLPEVVVNTKNCVLIEGTLIDPFTLITRDELDQNPALAKILQINGYKVYAIFNYANYPAGAPPELYQQQSRTPAQPPQQQYRQQQLPSQPQPSGNGRKIYHQ